MGTLIYCRAFWIILWTFWDILLPFGTFCVHLVHFVFIWYIFLILVSNTKKNLATLVIGTG
jgi:hypothetical protein